MGNRELTNARHVTQTSRWARRPPGLRHMDWDLMQYDRETREPECFFEVKSSPPASWRLTREMAHRHECYAMLVIEDPAHRCECRCSCPPLETVSVRLWDSSAARITLAGDLNEDEFTGLLSWIHVSQETARGGH